MVALITNPVQLTDLEKVLIARKSRAMLLWLVISQLLAGLVVTALFGVFEGQVAACSALVGAGAYWLPNTVAALRLALSTYKPQGASPLVLISIFFVKMLFAALLIGAFALMFGDQVNWLALLLGLIATLKGYVIALLFFGRKFL